MNKVVHEIHDNSKAAAESGKQILEQLAVMQEELLHLSETVKSLLPSDVRIPVSVEATLAAQGAGVLENEAPVDGKSEELQNVMDKNVQSKVTDVDIAASHEIRK